MPIHKCTHDGKEGYQWGQSGKCYTGEGALAKAQRQATAIYASGYVENSRRPTSRQLDPTRTITMRRAFSRSLDVLLRSLLREVLQVVVTEDGFGLKSPPLLNQTYSYSSTQVNITDRDVVREIQRIQGLIASSDVIKVENEPHITVRYGLFDQPRMVESVRTLLSGTGDAVARIGSLSLFEHDNQDVLKFDIESQHLTRLNERLGLLPNYDKFSTYHPHMTVAYVRKGTGQKYVVPSRVTGRQLVFSDIVYSTTEGEKTSIPLNGPLVHNQRWKYKSQDEAADAFEKWLSERVASSLTSPVEAARWRRYVKRGFETGANRALNDVKRGKGRGAKALRYIDSTRGAGYAEGQRETFLRTTLGRATAAEKLRALESQALSEVKGLSAEIVTRARRVVVDSLIRNLSPRELGERLSGVLKVSQGRARTIANTELVRAHAEGQLTAMEELGVEKVGVAVEWSSLKTACKLCSTLNGVVLTVKEARGMLPRHPNCRCAWTLANVGEDKEDKKEQKRSKTKIDKAVKKSQREGGDAGEWGPAKDIARSRPTVSNSMLEFSVLMERLGLV